MKYQTIVADPPWPFRWSGQPGGRRKHATTLGYPTMTLEEIKAFPVGELAESAAHLFLWVTPELNRKGIGVEVAQAWGFSCVGEIIWRKPSFGMGAFPRSGHEPLLVRKRGNLPFLRRDVHSVQTWKQVHESHGGKKHSAKPDGSFDLIRSASPGPYLELFARKNRLGWSAYGNECISDVELPA